MAGKRKTDEEPEAESTDAPRKRQVTAAGAADPEPLIWQGLHSYPTAHVYRLLEPGPVLLVTTGSLADGTHNIMTVGFHMVVQHEAPPLVAVALGPWDASFALLEQHRQCVLAVPSVEMVAAAVDVGNCSAADADDARAPGGKWTRFGLDARPAAAVRPPLVGGPDVIANVECVVADAGMVSKYSMWVLEPVRAWANPARRPGEGGTMFHHRGDGTFVVDGAALDLKSRMTKWKQFQD